MAGSISEEGLASVRKDFEEGQEFTFAHAGKVFGDAFWVAIVMALMDAQDAARAIQGAIARLSGKEE